jgi:hypothetical protein
MNQKLGRNTKVERIERAAVGRRDLSGEKGRGVGGVWWIRSCSARESATKVAPD